MNPYMLLVAVLAFGVTMSAAEWHGHHRGAVEVQAAWDKDVAEKTIAAAKVQSNHQTETIGVLNDAVATKPAVAADAVVADRMRHAFSADCPRLPKPSPDRPSIGSSSTVSPVDAGVDQRAAVEMKACVNLAHDYDTLHALWIANQAPEPAP